MSNQIPLHLYRCSTCSGYTLTRQLHAGSLPETTDCRAHGFYGCPGTALLVRGEWPADAPKSPRWEWVNLRKGRSIPSDENAAVAFAVSVAPLTLQAILDEEPHGARRG